jgi:hypothetical protein
MVGRGILRELEVGTAQRVEVTCGIRQALEHTKCEREEEYITCGECEIEKELTLDGGDVGEGISFTSNQVGAGEASYRSYQVG